MYKCYLLSLILVISCGSPNNRAKPADSPFAQLQDKAALYETLQQPDSSGFIMSDKCDSLLFTGLFSAALGDKWVGRIEDARSIRADGRVQWFRRPAQDCGVGGKLSHSTISRDMILGLMWHMWTHKRLDLATELMDDIRVNHYFLAGEGTPGELLMTPALVNTLAHIIKRLGGHEYETELKFPYWQTPGNGFVSHLTAWHILLRGQILHGVTDNEIAVLEDLVKREPQNPLFTLALHKYKDGGLREGVLLLLDEKHWPADRLPTSAEHCSDWPVQRDHDTPSKDWEPCLDEHEQHTGAEVVLLFNLIIKS